ncbi:sulfatase-like hydrolase/transferase [Gilvimarinus polysaccharolyticus]|uniref:sulfatase-like hydrolase/transferase n=1 Tax=Gilvimarinus polysaccharolyticus TaxID=863921 RepID=UPI0006735EC0|nr:sulfatase-like hydrolase/transferase [Gilvimarinus polysaccharolyticus]
MSKATIGTLPLFKRYGLFALLALLQVVLMAKVALQQDWSWLSLVSSSVVSAFSVVVFFLLWCSVFSRIPYRWAAIATKLMIAVYVLLLIYHWLRHEPLTFLIVYKNGADLFAWEALGYLWSNASPLGWLTLVVVVTLLVWVLNRYDLVATPLRYPAKVAALVTLLLLSVISVVAFSSSRNEFVEFGASVYQYFKSEAPRWDHSNPYPYLTKAHNNNSDVDLKDVPNVFVVMLESFSADYIDKAEGGRQVTPFFNQLKKEGFYLNNFFSGSVETSKGQFATLCSVYPSYKTNVFRSYPDNNFRCLSHILKERGYINVFMKAYHDLTFENTGSFISANGFDYVHGMDGQFVTAAEREKYKIGWGVRDDIFYQKTFKYLDELHGEAQNSDPFFVMTMSVTNHMMFDGIPPEHRYIHAEPASHRDNYANSMYLTDQYLKVFFQELSQRDYLKNSLVLVFGDNGFPMGQHNNYHNSKTVYNELFKTPLMVWWPGHVAPKVLTDTARSQLDVAPTILDLLGVDTDNHFVGKSVFSSPEEDYFVPLIQPFDGTYLASVRYPYKYAKHLKTAKELLFDLNQDPLEQHNLMPDDDLAVLHDVPLASFRRDIEVLMHNEALLKNNRIYPAGKFDNVRVVLETSRIVEGEPLVYKLLGDTEGVTTEITVESYVPVKSETVEAVASVEGKTVYQVAAARFNPGVNRVTFEVYSDNVLRSTTAADVFVAGENVTLLSELKVSGRQGWGKLHINRNVTGGPIRVADNIYSFGFGVHAASDYKIALDRDYTTLFVSFGLDDESVCGDGAVFKVLTVDGREIYASAPLVHGELDVALVNISGRQSIRLATFAGDNTACDHTNWINPVLYLQAPIGQ